MVLTSARMMRLALLDTVAALFHIENGSISGPGRKNPSETPVTDGGGTREGHTVNCHLSSPIRLRWLSQTPRRVRPVAAPERLL